ncbi:vacuolar protein sorting-associated protein 1 [Gurleya vavrai]
MDLLIEKINELQDICSDNNINHSLDLPQIVVIGSQSSGKSSVLENIVGRDFLPRGVGIVTRRPLILQLIYMKEAEQDFAIFNHKNEKFFDFELVKKEIIDETNREIKAKNDVSHKPITLKLFSKNVLTLTLIDLPGLVKVATNDQPKNICLKIEEMCRSYIINKNAIILAVSSANIDISNSDALQLARSVDNTYDRTIGVLTKIDLMDKGTDVINILSGRIIKLRFGFVPIVSRSQEDIDKNKSIKTALLEEKEFFANHLSYKSKNVYCGTSFLVSKLNFILHEHIKICLPELQDKVNNFIIKNQKELLNIGYVNLSPKETILKIINDITKKFSDILNGNFDNISNELAGGARINYTFHSHFNKYVSNLKPLEGISDEHIRTLLYNSSGSSSIMVFPHLAFERLTKSSISSLKPHSLKLVSIIFNELVKIAHQIVSITSLPRFPALQEKIANSLISLFKLKSEETHKVVSIFIDWNVNYLSAKHPDFIKWSDIVTKETEKIENNEMNNLDNIKSKDRKISFDAIPANLKITGQFTEHEIIEIGVMRSLVSSYFEITKKIFVDQIPKAIMSELVMKSEECIQETLFREIYEYKGIEDLVCESQESVEKRKKIEKNIIALKQAYDIICSI